MTLDPQARSLLDMLASTGAPPLHMLSVEQARQSMYQMLPLGGPPEAVAAVEDRQIPGTWGAIPVRIYTPQGNGPFPVFVFFHGGGWVIGDIATYDTVCRALTNAARCITVSVDYRLAPEYKFPVAIDDCYEATCWVAEHCATFNGNPERIAIGGDSAGGNLTAIISIMARDRGGPALAYQVLIYPATDFSRETASIRENAEGYLLTRQDMLWFQSLYFNNEDEQLDLRASPLLTPDLSGLPPALVITAEFDPLRDEGEMYATRLREAGVSVTASRYDGMIHLFLNMAGMLDQGKQALVQIGTELQKALGQ